MEVHPDIELALDCTSEFEGLTQLRSLTVLLAFVLSLAGKGHDAAWSSRRRLVSPSSSIIVVVVALCRRRHASSSSSFLCRRLVSSSSVCRPSYVVVVVVLYRRRRCQSRAASEIPACRSLCTPRYWVGAWLRVPPKNRCPIVDFF